MKKQFQHPGRTEKDICADVDEELRFHIETRQQELIGTGLSVDAARAQALREFGDIDDARQYLRNMDDSIESSRRRKDYVHDLMQDLRYALRSLRSSPSFAIVSILTLAIGIGANSSIFTVVNSVLRQSLPFPNADRLVRVWTASTKTDAPRSSVSAVDLDDWRAQKQQIADIGGWWFADGQSGTDLTGLGSPQRLATAFVSPGFFSTLEVAPFVGRLPREDELVRGGDDRVVVLSHAFWQRNFGGASNIIGSTVTLNGSAYRVLGVMPGDFVFPSPRVDVYVPFSTIPDNATPRIRPVRIMETVARLKPGVTVSQASAEMSAITGRLSEQYPENAGWGNATVVSLQESITGPVKTPLMVLLAAVTFVLLMACVNVASLLLARASTREREMAIRVSMGATGGRIARQLVTESLVLATLGGIVGVAIATLGTRALIALSAGQLPRTEEIHVNVTVLVFTLLTSLVCGLLFGLAPALRASSVDPQTALRASSRTSTGVSSRLRSGLVITQVSFAVVLSVGAVLLSRSFAELQRVEIGFKPDHLLAVNFTINIERHGDTTWLRYYREVIDRVRQVPGVIEAGAAQHAPFRGLGERTPFAVASGAPIADADLPVVPIQRISDNYFKTVGTSIIAGREFLPSDRTGPLSVVINRSFASKYFGDSNAVGKTVLMGGKFPATVLGVVGDIRQSAIAEAAIPLLYVYNEHTGRVKVTLVSRTKSDPLAMTNAIRDAIWSVDKHQTITSIFTYEDIVSEDLARPRMMAVLFETFGAIGIILGALGIYGVLAFLVTQRRREIGVRIALGARASGVVSMVLRRGTLLAGAGVAVGLIAALALSKGLAALLYGVNANDPTVYVGVGVAFAVVAMLASALPARRASRVDPLTAMQQE